MKIILREKEPNMEKITRESKELFDAILSLNSAEECEAFFEDL